MVIVRGEGATTSVAVTEVVSAGLLESATVKVTLVLPLAVGSPESTPLLPRLSPAGNALDAQLYGAAPPLTWSEPEYIVPTTPAGSEEVICRGVGVTGGVSGGGGVVIGGGGVEIGGGTGIFKPNCIVAVCAGELESVTVIVKEELPPEVGAPEITPVVEDRVSPEGNCPPVTLQVYAGVPPLAAKAIL
jgi:hypothetical protein